MDRMILDDDEKLICESVTKKDSMFLFISIPFTAIGLFIMIMPFLPFQWEESPSFFVSIFGSIFFLVGIFMFTVFVKSIKLSKTIQLILTDKRIFLYKKQFDENGIRDSSYRDINLIEILAWDGYIVSTTSVNGRVTRQDGKFIFETSSLSITSGKITNYHEMYKALFNIMPEKCLKFRKGYNPRYNADSNYNSHALNTYDENQVKLTYENYKGKDFSKGHIDKDSYSLGSIGESELYNIILNKVGPDRFEVMRLIRSYTLEDISKISEKLNKLPCVIIENSGDLQTERIINQLTDLGAEAYKR